jgi:hypothetical protein
MSISSDLDGGDLSHTLRKHQVRKRWLAEAEAWLRSDREAVSLNNYNISFGDGPGFTFDVPRSIWEPQLRAQVEEARRHVEELDRIVREYVEAALAI